MGTIKTSGIIISESNLGDYDKTLRNDKAAYASFMEYCKTSKKFPRNTYVCIADDINDIFDNMGDYYEQKINKENHEKDEPIITLGTLLDDYTNEIYEKS